jgi:hypothetical protein
LLFVEAFEPLAVVEVDLAVDRVFVVDAFEAVDFVAAGAAACVVVVSTEPVLSAA